jgi:5-methylcytosine-specific restriction endonuclease McrA
MTSRHIPRELVRRVRLRANDLCEYCRLPQLSQEATFHDDHIMPIVAGGLTTIDNLALACVTCSLRKAARQRLPDPSTGQLVTVFHPRKDRWSDHFA